MSAMNTKEKCWYCRCNLNPKKKKEIYTFPCNEKHRIHNMCFIEMLKAGNDTCGLCNKSAKILKNYEDDSEEYEEEIIVDRSINTLTGHTNTVCRLIIYVSDDKIHLISGSWDGKIKTWKLEDDNWQCIQTLKSVRPVSNYDVATYICNNVRYIAAGSHEMVDIWNTNTEQYTSMREPNTIFNQIISYIFKDKFRLITCSSDIKIWENGQCIKTLSHECVWGIITYIFEDKIYIASGSVDHNIKIWDAETFSHVKTLNGHSSFICCLITFIGSDNELYLASASRDHTIKIWRITDWQCLHTLTDHNDYVCALTTYTYNNQVYLVSGSEDKTIRIWDINTWKTLQVLTGHLDTIYCLNTYNHNNQTYIISGSRDVKIKIWDIYKPN